MEYVAGPDLQAAVGWDGPLAVADALRVLAQLAARSRTRTRPASCTAISSRRTSSSRAAIRASAKIIDFGLAKVAADEGLTRLTEDQQALGSPLYWAPEQSTNNRRSDRRPMSTRSAASRTSRCRACRCSSRAPPVALVYAHANEPPRAARAALQGVELPAGLDELVAACVAKSPAARPTRGGARRPSSIACSRHCRRRAAARPRAAAVHELGHERLRAGADRADPPGAARSRGDVRAPVDDIERISRGALRARARARDARRRRRGRTSTAMAWPRIDRAAQRRARRCVSRAARPARARDRGRARPPMRTALFEELDALVEQYRAL